MNKLADLKFNSKLSEKEIENAWEAGRSNPSPTARNLIYLIEKDNSLIEKLRT